MSAKRPATKELNYDNWDEEEEPEEVGHFRCAPEEELKSRVIKKARRTVTETATNAGGGTVNKTSVFSGFSGFGKLASSTSSESSPFSFLSKITDNTAKNADSKVGSSSGNKPNFVFNAADSNSGIKSDKNKLATNTTTDNDVTDCGDKSKEYCTKLISLNHAFCDWIKSCVDKNPLCFLTPIFQNYEDYLQELEKEEKERSSSNSAASSSSTTTITQTTSSTSAVPAASFSFGSSSAFGKTTSASTSSTTSMFGGFGSASTSSMGARNGFSFGTKVDDAKKKDAPVSSGFSFTTGGTPFSFGNIKPPLAAAPSNENGDDDDEDTPPKVEFKQVVEEDALYSKKCKVFIKKDESFVERGIGSLYLKSVQDGKKTQLLVRADTNLGNILVNFLLRDGIPAQRMGKNNVVLVCIPTPEEKKATSILLRVKTAEEADELLETITKYKK